MAIVGSSVGNVVGPSVGTPSGSSINLLNGLVSWYPLNEESGTRYDAHGSLDLTDNNTTGFAAGKVGNAGDFELSNTEYLNNNSASTLNNDNGDYTVSLWVNVESFPDSYQTIFGLSATTSDAMKIAIMKSSLTARFYATNYSSVSGENCEDGAYVPPSTATWYHILWTYDSSQQKASITVNNGTEYWSSTLTGDGYLKDNINRVAIGASAGGNNTPYDGLVDEVAIWHRLLTEQERTWLYNSGNGRSYDELQTTFWEYASLAAAESSGDGWQDGDDVWITGGARFKYYDALAVDGYSGLIHAEPYKGVSSVTIDSIDSVGWSEAVNTDPDSWVGFTDSSAGSKGVDYELDTNGGLARLRDLTTSGRCYLPYGSNPTSGQTEGFYIIDQVSASSTVSTTLAQSLGHLGIEVYADGVKSYGCRVDFGNVGGAAHKWRLNHTDANTNTELTQSPGSASRLFIYVKNGACSVWVDGEGSPQATSATPRNDNLASRSGWNICGNTSVSGTTTITLGAFVRGAMTTS